MKKIKSNHYFLIFFLLSFLFFSNRIYCFANSKQFIDVNVPSAVVIDAKTGRVLYDKNADEKRPMASLTKVMTSILLVENCKMDELIEIPSCAANIGGSTVGLKKGDKVTARSLLYGMLLPSGNDCAMSTAIHIGGTIENFANMMIKKAREIGVFDTSFANPHGLDNVDHYSSAKSMALIANLQTLFRHILLLILCFSYLLSVRFYDFLLYLFIILNLYFFSLITAVPIFKIIPIIKSHLIYKYSIFFKNHQ
mgnify:CR=1 FL=1